MLCAVALALPATLSCDGTYASPMPPPTNERRNTTPAIFAYVWTDAARRVALPCRWAAVIADLLVVRSGALLCTRTTAGGWKRMRRSPRRPKCRRLSGHDRVAQHPRECACNDPVSLAVGQRRLCHVL